ncbi:MAG TPA: hypothetical protein VGK59_22460 [Ohtaekwangia sp.]
MKTSLNKLAHRGFIYQKYLGLFLIAIGLPMFFFASGRNTDFPLMIGLFTVFTSMEKIEDERSVSLKTSSMYIAFVFAYTIKLVLTNLYQVSLIPFHMTEINHFIILVFVLAISVYYPRLYFSRR